MYIGKAKQGQKCSGSGVGGKEIIKQMQSSGRGEEKQDSRSKGKQGAGVRPRQDTK